jgi:glycogen synthase
MLSVRTQKKLRIAYLSGPVDGAAVHLAWLEKRQQLFVSNSYLGQFYEICSELDAEAYVITTLPGAHTLKFAGNILIENRPVKTELKGIRYHLAIGYWFLRLLPSLFRYKPDVMIVTALQNYWFLLSPLCWIRVTMVPAFHCTLWPKFLPIQRSWRALMHLNRILFFKSIKAVIVVSEDIAEQVRSLTRDHNLEIIVFKPTYVRGQFASVPPASQLGKTPFRIMFAGRIEINKGIYDLLEIAKRLFRVRKDKFLFDICGEGSQLVALRKRIEELGLEHVVFCHGQCDPHKMRIMLGLAHVVIIPTTTSFEEGFNKVCAEAVLAGRPIITSAVCPALASVRGAAVEVQPGNIDEYYNAILNLHGDHTLYHEKCSACIPLQEQFYDYNNSWGAKLRYALNIVLLRSGPLSK